MIVGLPPLVFLVVAFALLFDFTNGWHDSANAVATVISTRVMAPVVAIVMAAILN
ncbi:MAG TPA: inorganic phosphate transporter, partial [Thermoanaerobaculia bacterium]|nr:inorganic phosphate transporter [Thermoanaerobaculia bacterium]